MQGTHSPPPGTAEAAHPQRVRTWSGWVASVVATLLTALAALGAFMATQTYATEADIYLELAGLVAVIAAVVWLAAIILLRPSGWAIPALTSLLAVLIGAGIYGGLRDPGGRPVVVASVVVLVGCFATLLWNLTAAHGHRQSPPG